MPRQIYRSSTVTIPTKFATWDADKLTEVIDRKTNEMAEDGWRLATVTPPPPGGQFYLLVFEKPAIESDR